MKNLKNAIITHISNHIGLFALFWFAMLAGLVCGACMTGNLNEWDTSDVNGYLNGFLYASIGEGELDYLMIFCQSVIQNLQILILMFVFGFSVLCIPFSVLLVAFRSVIAGFSMWFVIASYGFGGVFMVALGLLPSVLLTFFMLIESAVLATNNALSNMRRNRSDTRKRFLSVSTTGEYLRTFGIYAGIAVAAALVDTFFTPNMLGLIFRLI